MEIIIISAAALLTSGLTLFSGFGLGTLLLPVFALFFPVEIAISLTAIVHFLNNIFKTGLMFRFIDYKIVLLFGIPAAIAAFFGALLLSHLSELPPLFNYSLGETTYSVEVIKIIISLLIFFFALVEILPALEDKFILPKRYIGLGGLMSGFFGGLSGHQGALRSAFLIKMNLPKEVFIGTGIAIALMIDITRISVYATTFSDTLLTENSTLLIIATLSAFIGAFIGRLLMKKVTYKTVKIIVSMLLFLTSGLLAAGLI
jgi:uncharacterized protein